MSETILSTVGEEEELAYISGQDYTEEFVWKVLSAINVNEFVEQRGGTGFRPKYLSWTHALSTMYSNFPEFQFNFVENEEHSDGSMTVHARCSIGHVKRACWLPVMNHKFVAINNPNSREISDAKMRCLTKCMALFGLGLYIYASEDIPLDDTTNTHDPKTKSPDPVSGGQAEKVRVITETMQAAIDVATAPDELRDAWKKNSVPLKELEEIDSGAFGTLLGAFKEATALLTKE